jgi:hypothetical protein
MRDALSIGVASFALALIGCSHAPPPQRPPVGVSHRPYTGSPSYLVAQSSGRLPDVPNTRSASPLSDARQAEVRALLAAADADVAALGDQPPPETIAALSLTTDRLATLLAPLTDLTAEVDELRSLIAELPRVPKVRLPQRRARMNELLDLIRLQLLATR